MSRITVINRNQQQAILDVSGDVAAIVEDLLDLMEPRHRRVLQLHFGLGADHDRLHFREIAARFRLSAARIHQLENQAIESAAERVNVPPAVVAALFQLAGVVAQEALR